ncbi:MAG: hypothetical protein KC516_04205 [Nanoarchaeota archaeon]|nr:hypothetical protein [Nanoarchaeota archaeon]
MEEQPKSEEDEMREVEVWEFSLSNSEIVNFITKLNELRVTKESVSFDVDDENEILIHYMEEDSEVEVPNTESKSSMETPKTDANSVEQASPTESHSESVSAESVPSLPEQKPQN